MARTIEPTKITRGERIEWTKSLCDYPATEYSLEYRIRGAAAGIDVNATAEGDDFNCVITKEASAAIGGTGRYKWQAWITEIADTDNTFVVGEGFVTVQAGFDTDSQAAVDLRTPAKIALESIDAALSAFAASDVTEYEIETPAGRRRIKKSDKSQLMSMRKYYAGIVANENLRERMAAGGPFAKPIKSRMWSS